MGCRRAWAMLAVVSVVLSSHDPARAQASRLERLRPTTPEQDARPNDDSVPAVYAIDSRFERVVVLRLKHRADLLAGIERAVEEEEIANAVILSGIGSVRSYHVHTVSNRDFPSKNIFVADPTAPADIVSMNGYVIDGRVHAHLALADADRAWGGHLEPETRVFTFAIVTLGVFEEPIDFSRVDDKTHR